MLIRNLFYCLILAVLGCSATSSTVRTDEKRDVIRGSELNVLGRFDHHDGRLELISSAAHFGVSFEGKEVVIVASTLPGQFGYLQYEIDGAYQKRVRVQGQRQEVKITAGGGSHSMRVFKTTEATTGPVFIDEVRGYNIRSSKVDNRPIIEFIGNSITCGAAADPSEIPCGSGSYHDQHNAYMAYGPRIARALNANFMLTSVSGIGIYRNWNSDGPTMPQVFEKTDLREESTRSWDFTAASPSVVSIALGTNDFSNGDGKKTRPPFDSAAFTKKYIAFVKTVKSHYPDAKIALLNSPMVSGNRNDILVACLNRVKQKIDAEFPADKPVSIFLFEAMKAQGCGGHPNVEDHGIMADQMEDHFRQLLLSQ